MRTNYYLFPGQFHLYCDFNTRQIMVIMVTITMMIAIIQVLHVWTHTAMEWILNSAWHADFITLNISQVHLAHWGRVTHICVSKLTIIAGILLIRPLGTNVNEMLIEILKFSFMKMRLKVSSAKWRPFRLGLNVVKTYWSFSIKTFKNQSYTQYLTHVFNRFRQKPVTWVTRDIVSSSAFLFNIYLFSIFMFIFII